MRGAGARAVFTAIALATVVSKDIGVTGSHQTGEGRRMSFHNRLLLNRATLAGLRTIEVLVLSRAYGDAGVVSATGIAARVDALGGTVSRSEPDVGYLRVQIPTARLLQLVDSDAVEAYQISSLSRGAWYRDGPPLSDCAT